MNAARETAPPAALCSRLSAERGLPLVGSAGHYDVIVAFELEPPWTARLVRSRASDAALDDAITNIASGPARLLALEPSDALRRGRGPGRARVLVFFREEGAFRGYARRELDVARDELAETLGRIGSACDDPAAIAHADIGEAASDDLAARDVLVCTHGARDACCGKFGYGLFLEVEALAKARGDLRVWRSSHLGGHRFAPTMLDLPSGRMYGRLAAGDASAVIAGGDDLAQRLSRIYRGRSALPEPAQIVERELWLREGAAFERRAIAWSVVELDDAWDVCVESEGAASHRSRVVRAEVDAVVTPASCGRDPEPEAPWKLLD